MPPTADDIIAANKTWNVFNSLGDGKNVYQETIDNVSYNTYVLLYNKALTKGETTLPSLFKVYLDAQIDIDPEGQMYRVVNGNAAKVEWNIKTNNQTYAGYARLKATFNNCVMDQCFCLNGDSTFYGCTFNSDGKAILLYGQANTNLVVNKCTFNDTGVLPDLKAAIEIGNDYNKSYTVTVTDTTVNGYEINDKGINTGSTLWGNKNSMPQDKLNVVGANMNYMYINDATFTNCTFDCGAANSAVHYDELFDGLCERLPAGGGRPFCPFADRTKIPCGS